MALKLYKVAISGFFLTYAESPEKAFNDPGQITGQLTFN